VLTESVSPLAIPLPALATTPADAAVFVAGVASERAQEARGAVASRTPRSDEAKRGMGGRMRESNVGES
jgi:hypothetical protein